MKTSEKALEILDKVQKLIDVETRLNNFDEMEEMTTRTMIVDLNLGLILFNMEKDKWIEFFQVLIKRVVEVVIEDQLERNAKEDSWLLK